MENPSAQENGITINACIIKHREIDKKKEEYGKNTDVSSYATVEDDIIRKSIESAIQAGAKSNTCYNDSNKFYRINEAGNKMPESNDTQEILKGAYKERKEKGKVTTKTDNTREMGE